MKTLALFCLLSFSFNALADFALTCPEIYERTLDAKEVKKENANDWGYKLMSAGTAMQLASPIIGAALLIPGSALTIYGNISCREERAMAIMDEADRSLEKFTKKLQKKISPNITSEEIVAIMKQGLESGYYCAQFPKLASRKEIKKHVIGVLAEKYQSQNSDEL